VIGSIDDDLGHPGDVAESHGPSRRIGSVDRLMQEIPDIVAWVEGLERRLAKDKIRFVVGISGGYHSGIWSAWETRTTITLVLGALSRV
jgi:hypothetical protein